MARASTHCENLEKTSIDNREGGQEQDETERSERNRESTKKDRAIVRKCTPVNDPPSVPLLGSASSVGSEGNAAYLLAVTPLEYFARCGLDQSPFRMFGRFQLESLPFRWLVSQGTDTLVRM